MKSLWGIIEYYSLVGYKTLPYDTNKKEVVMEKKDILKCTYILSVSFQDLMNPFNMSLVEYLNYCLVDLIRLSSDAMLD